MLELAILGLLKEQDLHGYELKKRLTEALGPLSSVSFGSLYPALSRLERKGAVAVAPAEPELSPPPVPMTGSIAGEVAAFRARRAAGRHPVARAGRGRKVYRLTPAGDVLFGQLLESEPVDDDRAFSLRLAFCRHLRPDARLGLLERRRAQLVERLARARATFRGRRDGMDTFTRSVVEHGAETTERDITWLDELIAIERRNPQNNPPENPDRDPRETPLSSLQEGSPT
ncbi:MAG TPA: PadR family transcriptional regulator [Acidimicrobiales bacterium]|nr:PadR family transcriptional regulator [Acidimicrobiales bacterium]